MSKAKGLDISVRVIFLALIGFLTLFLSLLFLAVFVAVVGWYIWGLNDKTKALEERISALEGPAGRPQVIQKEKEVITRESVKIPCRFCGALVDNTASKCPSCGAKLR